MKKLLVIGYVWPEPNSSAAGSRMMQLIHVFQQQNFQVTFCSSAKLSENMIDLEYHNIEQVTIELNNNSFNDFIKRLNPKVVLFDRFMIEEQYSWRVEKECPAALRILETVDLHCLRYARHQVVKSNKDAFAEKNIDFNNDVALREIASILRCDLSLLISKYEVKILKTIYKVQTNILLYLPFMFEPLSEKKTTTKWLSCEERKDFVTIGNFRHEPNWDSVLYLKKEIWPLIRAKLKNTELHIYGAYPPKKAQQLQNIKQGFHVKGWADNAINTLGQYRVFLSPLRFGAGLKGKLADAMLSGTPSVTTSIGAESMYGKYDWPGAIADTAKTFAEASCDLYENQNKWQESQLCGIRIINNIFNKDINVERFVEKIYSILESLETHRENNFTGSMLRYHTLKSAMYMSKWIEEKNKQGDQEQ